MSRIYDLWFIKFNRNGCEAVRGIDVDFIDLEVGIPNTLRRPKVRK